MNIGIIGCGNISAAYLRLGPMFKGVDIVAVADMNMDAATARAAEFGVDARSVDALLASDDIDVIINLTIPDAHFDVTCSILKAGKHAYSEKPLVLTLDQAKAMQKLCDDSGLRVGSAPDTFLGGAHQQARQIIDAGGIGKVVAGTAHVMSKGMEHWHPNPDFFFLPGAGPVLDIGPYYVTNLIQLLGPVKRVAALTSAAKSERTIANGPRNGEVVPVKTPTNIHALLEFEQGATITLSASWDITAHDHQNMEIYGEDGTLYVPDPNFFGGDLHQSDAVGQMQAVAAWDHPFGVINDNGRANYRCAGLADMVAGITEGRPHRCDVSLAVHATDVMTSILKSGQTGQFEAMTTTCTKPAPLGIAEAKALLK